MTESTRRPTIWERLAGPTTALVGVASATDFLTHYTNGRAILERRLLLAQFAGDPIANHIGNFGHSAAIMIPFTLASELLHHQAEVRHSRTLETVANVLPVLGFAFAATVNLIAELTAPVYSQLTGDLLFGLGAAVLAHVATRGAMQRFYRAAASPTSPPAQ